MTGVEVIVAALAAGAAAGSSDAAKKAVADAYEGLRGALRDWLASHGQAEQILDAQETDPGVWQSRLGAALTHTGADRDDKILAAAHDLLALDRASTGSYVDLRGNHTTNGPTGMMTGPITITYNQQPVPPAAPEA